MTTGVVTDINRMCEALDEVIADGVTGLFDDELHARLVGANELRRRAEVLEVQALAEMDLRRSHEPTGARTAATYAAWNLPMTQADAQTRVRCARALPLMPLIANAFHAGRLSVDQVRMYARCQATDPATFTVMEAKLLQHAFDFDMRDLKRILDHWVDCADPDGSLRDAEDRYDGREASMYDLPNGNVLLKAELDPVAGEIVKNVLDGIDQELFTLDWDAAKAIHGEDTCAEDLARRPQQRYADALEIMARRAAMITPGAEDAGPRPLITVLIGEAAYFGLCETEGGRHLDPHDTLRLLTRAEAERVVFDSPSRVVDVGVRQRFFTGATRRAVEVRDGECQHPSCHAPVTRAHAHHIEHYENGGETVQDNGTMLCAWHHRWTHRQPPPAD